MLALLVEYQYIKIDNSVKMVCIATL